MDPTTRLSTDSLVFLEDPQLQTITAYDFEPNQLDVDDSDQNISTTFSTITTTPSSAPVSTTNQPIEPTNLPGSHQNKENFVNIPQLNKTRQDDGTVIGWTSVDQRNLLKNAIIMAHNAPYTFYSTYYTAIPLDGQKGVEIAERITSSLEPQQTYQDYVAETIDDLFEEAMVLNNVT